MIHLSSIFTASFESILDTLDNARNKTHTLNAFDSYIVTKPYVLAGI